MNKVMFQIKMDKRMVKVERAIIEEIEQKQRV